MVVPNDGAEDEEEEHEVVVDELRTIFGAVFRFGCITINEVHKKTVYTHQQN